MDREKELQAARCLEDLTVIMKEMARNIRNGSETDAYAAVYWLRREIGYVTATLGGGVPNTSKVAGRYLAQIEERRTRNGN
jgi:hypothetical protein